MSVNDRVETNFKSLIVLSSEKRQEIKNFDRKVRGEVKSDVEEVKNEMRRELVRNKLVRNEIGTTWRGGLRVTES